MIAATVEQFTASPTFELVWPICFITFLVFWRSASSRFTPTPPSNNNSSNNNNNNNNRNNAFSHPRVTRAPTPPPPLLLEEKQQREEGHRRPTAHVLSGQYKRQQAGPLFFAKTLKEDAPEEPPLEKAPLPTSRDVSPPPFPPPPPPPPPVNAKKEL